MEKGLKVMKTQMFNRKVSGLKPDIIVITASKEDIRLKYSSELVSVSFKISKQL